ncbi:hypothetical protein VE02_03037 [Pseudogymnoascus sp. 03VT05]|nr:hypothetical protein VE02_03037 [Pseudogymnoascus sp. 03VT05]
MRVNMRCTVALTLAALAFGAVTANAHNTLDEVNEYHATEVDTETVDCTDTSSLPDAVKTFYSTHVHQSVKYTLASGHTLVLPTEIIGGLASLTSIFHYYSPTEGQQIDSATISAEEQPTESSCTSTASTSTGEEPVVSTVPSFTSTEVESTFVTVPASSESFPAIVSTSSAEAHSEASTEPAPVTTAEQPSATKEIIPPVVSTETPLTNPLRPTVTPSDTPTTASITLTTTETLPGASTYPVKEGVSAVSSEASEATIQNPHKTHGGPPIVSVASSILSLTTETLTNSHTTVVTVIENPTNTPFAVDCFSTTYVTVYSPPSPPASVATAPPSYTAIAQPSTLVVATGVPHPSNNTTVVATGIPRPNNTTTGQTPPPIHGTAPTLSATPGLLLAFCGLICYLI